MKKYNKVFLLSLFLLSGCNFIKINNSSSSSFKDNSTISSLNSSSSSSSSSSTKIEESTSSKEEKKGYYKAENQSISFDDVRKSYIYKNDLPSIGNNKLLVVPVKFKDSNFAEQFGGYDKVKENIEQTFFGASDETGWESVSSFYKKSSYNKLNLSGEVTDWFELDMSFLEMTALEGYHDQSIYVLREIGEWYNENYGSADEYDVDNDGYIDSVWMVYDYPANHTYNTDWAYAYCDFATENVGTEEDPIPYTYAWASIGFMYEGNYKNENNEVLVDAHTFIHETGHLLGLPDYYDYDGKASYAGGLDMMDHNIGDHTSFSKYLLNWVNPYVVEDDCEITINSFTETGDFIIVKDDWNKSALDEYLVVEFYTPTGLNKQDSESRYAGKYPALYTIPGIKIYHVDARIGYFENYRFRLYVDSVYSSSDNPGVISTQLAHSNTSSRSVNPKFHLYHLLEKGATTKLTRPSGLASNETLFLEDDIFDPEIFERSFANGLSFNDNEEMGYLIQVKEISESQATIKFIQL